MQGYKRYSLAVIIPNYNKEKYLYECVQSVFRQTLLPDEVIIVDDCSADMSRDIIEKLRSENRNLTAIYLEKNGGVSHARNVGLHHANTEFITFLDADDYYLNDKKLENEMGLIKKSNEDIIAYSQFRLANSDGTVRDKIILKKSDYLTGNIFRRLLIGKFSWPAMVRDYCVKKSILVDLGGYNEERNLYEDFELLLKLAKGTRFLCTYESGTAYRQLDNSLSKRDMAEHNRVRAEIFDEMLKPLPKWKRVLYIFQKNWQDLCVFFEINIVQKLKAMVKTVIGR